MKTNVSIELDKDQLTALAAVIDGDPPAGGHWAKRTATRAEINAFCQGAIDGAIADPNEAPRPAADHIRATLGRTGKMPPQATMDEAKVSLGSAWKMESYIRGYNAKSFTDK